MSTSPPDLTVPEGASWEQLRDPLTALLHSSQGAVVVATSGSTGEPKRVRLPASSIRASGEATAEVLGGHGQWLLALPTHHVAGLQVLARSALAGTEPSVLDPDTSFTPESLTAGIARLDRDGRRYASLVPTQLRRALDSPAATEALASLDAILVGGAAADQDLLADARAAGVTVVTTYGMSETCGGCVYDGVPLLGVQVRTEGERILLGGPVLADGYVGAPELTASRFVTDADGRWFVTDDRGVCRDGRLVVLGRLDDVIVTGGHKVDPADVEAALRSIPTIEDALVVGIEDREWGHRVAALVTVAVVPSDGRTSSTAAPQDSETRAAALREALRGRLPAHAVPRQLVVVDGIPLLRTGKPDRARAQEILRHSGRMDQDPH